MMVLVSSLRLFVFRQGVRPHDKTKILLSRQSCHYRLHERTLGDQGLLPTAETKSPSDGTVYRAFVPSFSTRERVRVRGTS